MGAKIINLKTCGLCVVRTGADAALLISGVSDTDCLYQRREDLVLERREALVLDIEGNYSYNEC